MKSFLSLCYMKHSSAAFGLLLIAFLLPFAAFSSLPADVPPRIQETKRSPAALVLFHLTDEAPGRVFGKIALVYFSISQPRKIFETNFYEYFDNFLKI